MGSIYRDKPTPKPKPKPSKTPYVKSKEQPGLQGGKTARAKADLQKAIKGGAAKAAKKLAPNDTVKSTSKLLVFDNGKNIREVVKYKNVTSPRQQAKRNMIANNIINDKSKTAMRAKIVEMNAEKKRTKKKK
jgi:hypothetical protein